jgi:hypothetical protein
VLSLTWNKQLSASCVAVYKTVLAAQKALENIEAERGVTPNGQSERCEASPDPLRELTNVGNDHGHLCKLALSAKNAMGSRRDETDQRRRY